LKNRDLLSKQQKDKIVKSYTKSVAYDQVITLFPEETRKKSRQMSLKVTAM